MVGAIYWPTFVELARVWNVDPDVQIGKIELKAGYAEFTGHGAMRRALSASSHFSAGSSRRDAESSTTSDVTWRIVTASATATAVTKTALPRIFVGSCSGEVLTKATAHPTSTDQARLE